MLLLAAMTVVTIVTMKQIRTTAVIVLNERHFIRFY